MGIREYDIPAEAFEAWTLQPEQYDKTFEYIGGVAVERDPHYYAAVVNARLSGHLMEHIGLDSPDWVLGAKAGYRVGHDYYVPNVSYLRRERLPALPQGNGYLDLAPDLAVHMILPDALTRDAVVRLPNYLHAGTTVWYIYPDLMEVQVYVPGYTPVILGKDDKMALNGGDVLPGFKLNVAEIFPKS